MARMPNEHDPAVRGSLDVRQTSPDFVEVFFIPSDSLLEAAGISARKAWEYRKKLLDINGRSSALTIFPISTFPNRPNFLKQRYEKIERITFEDTDIIFTNFDGGIPTTAEGVLDILENLPAGFVRNYSYGLGILKAYRFIVEAVETLSNCSEVVISNRRPTGRKPDCDLFYISTADFEQARCALGNIDKLVQVALRSVKTAKAHNILAERLDLPRIEPNTGRHPYRKLFTSIAQGKEELSKDEQNAVITAISSHAVDIAKTQPEKLVRLRGDIDQATLRVLIDKYAEMLDKTLPEGQWQLFFKENPFILSMAFGYPIIMVCDQASVGGRQLSGNGGKITDFLVKNSITNNTALVEIKTPNTVILNERPFRGGVYAPTTHLSGSICQALDQKYRFQKEIALFKENSRLHNIESYAIHCCLVIGRTPDDENKKKSFEQFRRNSNDVEIVTFDELLEKLKQLSDFLHAVERKDTP